MKSDWNVVWKIPVVLVASAIGYLAAIEAGWSGTQSIVNAYTTFHEATFHDFIRDLYFVIVIAIALGVVFLVKRLAKPALWILVPILLYATIVLGAWNGFMSDFDPTRGEALKHHYANAYSIEHMTARGRYLSCHDKRIELTDDAKTACARDLGFNPKGQ
jgi:hypothetical protein